MSQHRLTERKRKFAEAYAASCKVPGDYSTGDVEAACRVAGYSHPKYGYRLVTSRGDVKDPSVLAYLKTLDAKTAHAEARALPDADTELTDAERTLVELRSVRDDPTSPPGAKVRAAELLLKHHGVDRPSGDDDEADPAEALRHMKMLLGVEGDVDPFYLGSQKAMD